MDIVHAFVLVPARPPHLLHACAKPRAAVPGLSRAMMLPPGLPACQPASIAASFCRCLQLNGPTAQALQVADFASPRDLSFAATPDASHVAICDRGALHIWRAETGARFQVFPLPAQQHLAPMPSASSGGDGGSGRREDCWHTGAVQALQWSPDGRRLLFLVRRSGGGMREWAVFCELRSWVDVRSWPGVALGVSACNARGRLPHAACPCCLPGRAPLQASLRRCWPLQRHTHPGTGCLDTSCSHCAVACSHGCSVQAAPLPLDGVRRVLWGPGRRRRQTGQRDAVPALQPHARVPGQVRSAAGGRLAACPALGAPAPVQPARGASRTELCHAMLVSAAPACVPGPWPLNPPTQPPFRCHRYLPFFDQYSRSLRLWSPDSCAFCFCARGQPAGERRRPFGTGWGGL